VREKPGAASSSTLSAAAAVASSWLLSSHRPFYCSLSNVALLPQGSNPALLAPRRTLTSQSAIHPLELDTTTVASHGSTLSVALCVTSKSNAE
jgi:hypothetical protein